MEQTIGRAKKAIPIVDPATRAVQPGMTMQPNPTTLDTASSDNEQQDLQPRPKGSDSKNRGKELDSDIERAFDVYATPFIPKAYRVVNSLPGRFCITPATKQINFGEYAVLSLGSAFLPAVPHSTNLPDRQQETHLNPTQYEKYFRGHLNIEVESQTRENASYSLYGHKATVQFSSAGDETATVSIVVPGLREYSPYVEEDDIIELRQFRLDMKGNPVDLYHQYFLSRIQRAAGPWTQRIYHARVTASIRASETIVLQVQGLTPTSAEITLYDQQPLQALENVQLTFNVQFPVPQERYMPMESVLTHVQGALDRAKSETYRQQDFMEAKGNHYWFQSMLFPTEADCDVQANVHSSRPDGDFFDASINFEQRKAVENICAQNYGVLPFLISGPPGTGKTKTLIETALQMITHIPNVHHILICAPSEPAADTLASRLTGQLTPHELLRLNRPNRTFSEVADTLLPYCFVSEDKFTLPPFAQLMRYRVVVTSCRDASMLLYSRMTNTDLYAVQTGLNRTLGSSALFSATPRLHWSAVLIDEAAQATEPEALVPLYVVAPPIDAPKPTFVPVVVMAGDEYQLGPRTSVPGRSTPLKRSLFARLFARRVYASHPLARARMATVTRAMLPMLRPAFANLVRNYRSHPAILAVPSAVWYGDTLEACAPAIHRLAGWNGWPGRWPVLFRDNGSDDDVERGDGAGGWFNAGEGVAAREYATALVRSGLVTAEEVCVMSPFKAQVRRLRTEMRNATSGGLWGVNVGPTEAFQGLEYGVVILCVTRARARFVARDKELGWGVLGMPNKMNVALTRAKFGLIVIGKRELLSEDPDWKVWLDFCDRNGLVESDRPHNVIGNGSKEAAKGDEAASDTKLTRIERMLLASEMQSNGDAVLGSKARSQDDWQ